MAEADKRTTQAINQTGRYSSGRPLTGGVASPLRSGQNRPRQTRPRQKAPSPARREDPILKSMRWLALMGWLLLIGAVFVAGMAQPQSRTYYHTRHAVAIRDTWNYDMVPFILLLCTLSFVVSMVGVFVNLTKGLEKGDFVHVNFLALSLASLMGILFYFAVLL
ncbi:MAG: hypothetical protein PHP44_12620 [Kiritimatiellae bacterium]|nr:hypothetical protein [Kiritimatiellia bacterium]